MGKNVRYNARRSVEVRERKNTSQSARRRARRRRAKIRRIRRFMRICLIFLCCIISVIYVVSHKREKKEKVVTKNTDTDEVVVDEFESRLSEFKDLYVSQDDSNKYSGYTVCLDAGHGGNDAGAEGSDGSLEKNQTLKLTYMVKSYLESVGINVVLTRTKDEFLSLEDRRNIAEEGNVDLLVSIHRNIYEGTEDVNGIEAWVNNSKPEKSMEIAESILEQVSVCVEGVNNRGVKWGTMDNVNENYALNRVSMDSMILEIGFMTSDHDNYLFNLYMEEIAKGIAMGIINQI